MSSTGTLKRPYVIVSMASSADGKVTTHERLKLRYGSDEDRKRLEQRRCEAEAVLIGKGALLSDDPPLLVRSPEAADRRERERGRGERHPLNVLVASRLDFDASRFEFFGRPDTKKRVYTTAAATETRRETVAIFAEVRVVSSTAEGRVELAEVFEDLASLGVKRLLVEGGGTLNFSVLASGLADEIRLTVAPFLFGGQSAPGWIGGNGFSHDAIRRLELVSCESVSTGEVFLVWKVTGECASAQESQTFRHGWMLR